MTALLLLTPLDLASPNPKAKATGERGRWIYSGADHRGAQDGSKMIDSLAADVGTGSRSPTFADPASEFPSLPV